MLSLLWNLACSSEPPAPALDGDVGDLAGLELPAAGGEARPEEPEPDGIPFEIAAIDLESSHTPTETRPETPESAPVTAETYLPKTEPAVKAGAAPVTEPAETEPAEVPTVEEPAPAEPTEPAAEPARTLTYTLAPERSSLLVQVFKDPDTAAAAMSHDHVVAASGWSGTVTWNPDDLSQCAIDISVPVSELVVDSPRLRAAVGLEGELSASQRGDVKKNMLAKDQLHGDRYGRITYSASRCEASGERVLVTGELTIRGQSETVKTKLEVSATATRFSASGSFKARATDFGFEPFTAMLGALKNQDAMSFSVKLSD
jgi:polyisoprenoid-binding protein YceI